jgi:hypothetical protein
MSIVVTTYFLRNYSLFFFNYLYFPRNKVRGGFESAEVSVGKKFHPVRFLFISRGESMCALVEAFINRKNH